MTTLPGTEAAAPMLDLLICLLALLWFSAGDCDCVWSQRPGFVGLDPRLGTTPQPITAKQTASQPMGVGYTCQQHRLDPSGFLHTH